MTQRWLSAAFLHCAVLALSVPLSALPIAAAPSTWVFEQGRAPYPVDRRGREIQPDAVDFRLEPPPPTAAERAAGRFTPPEVPIDRRLNEAGFALGETVFVRIIKSEHVLELWMADDQGRYRKYRDFPICKWSGKMGPKIYEGDGQAPEGFYQVTRKQLNPNSQYHRAFNLGYPNAFDQAHRRTGGLLMVHGDCTSIGCYAMTDNGMDDIYRIVEAALAYGQESVPVHIYPFRMRQAALDSFASHRWHHFWKQLAPGYAAFEEDGVPPRAYVCGDRYQIARGEAPSPEGCAPVRGWQ